MLKTRYSLKDVLKQLQKFKELSTLGKLVTSTEETKFNPYIDCFTKDGERKGYNKWTLLKLVALLLYVPLYTSIIKEHFAEWFYIDLFAGSGVSRLEETDIVIAGSPIISLAFSTSPFRSAYFNDANRQKIEILRKRIALLKEFSKSAEYRDYILSDLTETDTKFFTNDANRIIFKIYSEIEQIHSELLKRTGKGAHVLVFIDPYGLQFNMSSLRRILKSKVRSDIIILFNSYAAGLQAYNHIHYGISSNELDNCLGKEWLEYVEHHAKNENMDLQDLSRNRLSVWLCDYYIEIMKKHNHVPVTIRLPLRLEAQQFDLIFAPHKTSSGNPFINGINYIKRVLEATKYELVEELKVYLAIGKMPGLIQYMFENPETALERYMTSKRYGIQKVLTLDVFMEKNEARGCREKKSRIG